MITVTGVDLYSRGGKAVILITVLPENQEETALAFAHRQLTDFKSWIKVDLNGVSMFTYPEQPGMVVVNFEQDYSSNNLSNRMKKRQYWIKQNNRWQIIYEGSA